MMELKVHLDCTSFDKVDDTLAEAKSVVTLLNDNIPELPPIDVIIHFPQSGYGVGDSNDLPF